LYVICKQLIMIMISDSAFILLFWIQLLCSFVLTQQDKANAHKKLLDDAEEHFRFKEEAKDLVKLLFLSLSITLLACHLHWVREIISVDRIFMLCCGIFAYVIKKAAREFAFMRSLYHRYIVCSVRYCMLCISVVDVVFTYLWYQYLLYFLFINICLYCRNHYWIDHCWQSCSIFDFLFHLSFYFAFTF